VCAPFDILFDIKGAVIFQKFQKKTQNNSLCQHWDGALETELAHFPEVNEAPEKVPES
jgi:hypothetical protein